MRYQKCFIYKKIDTIQNINLFEPNSKKTMEYIISNDKRSIDCMNHKTL